MCKKYLNIIVKKKYNYFTQVKVFINNQSKVKVKVQDQKSTWIQVRIYLVKIYSLAIDHQAHQISVIYGSSI